ncbi:Protein of unknown function (DUF1479) domain containing protein [Rhypophila sp. PSN 637]
MGNSTVPSVDNISDREFQDYLGRYPSCIEAISQAKGAKPGQKTLAELDEYRYVDALDLFRPGTAKPMEIDHVKTLVEWKLRHGKFRPTLMNLVSSNDPKTVKETIQKAVKAYQDKSDVSTALGILTQLKGIGPATASLLLAVHDEENVIFFADEAFYWLCCGGSKGPIKYNLKEYMTLHDRAQAVSERLGVKAVDVERVAFVLMRQQEFDVPKTGGEKNPGQQEVPENKKIKSPSARDTIQKLPKKRKPSAEEGEIDTHLRRSKLTCALRQISSTTSNRKRKYDMPSPLFASSISLPKRFATVKDAIVSRSELPLASSWNRLLQQLREDVDRISSAEGDIIPTIDFADIPNPDLATGFLESLRDRGVAVIRRVVPHETATEWGQELEQYLGEGHGTMQASLQQHRPLHNIFWSPPQIEARAHPNVLAAQKFVMRLWKSEDPDASISTNFPVAYADRVRTQISGPGNQGSNAHVDGGSAERWEKDGYGDAGTYRNIFNGRWEDYDPWESSSRINVTSDLYRGASSCSIFRMFSGWLSLTNTTTEDGPSLRVLPMPKLATSYFLLRPFFSPVSPSSNAADSSTDWKLDTPQNSLLHGALPGYPQEIIPDMHPHLQLEKSLISIPPLNPGDYVIWHPDLVHAVGGSPSNTAPSTLYYRPPPHLRNDTHSRLSRTVLYLPACPLTQTNALYLSRQRKAFLLGYPGPDFDVAGYTRSGSMGPLRDERRHSSRASVQTVNDTGGDDGLRAMGLLPWDEEDAESDAERRVLEMANAILFPDLFER